MPASCTKGFQSILKQIGGKGYTKWGNCPKINLSCCPLLFSHVMSMWMIDARVISLPVQITSIPIVGESADVFPG